MRPQGAKAICAGAFIQESREGRGPIHPRCAQMHDCATLPEKLFRDHTNGSLAPNSHLQTLSPPLNLIVEGRPPGTALSAQMNTTALLLDECLSPALITRLDPEKTIL